MPRPQLGEATRLYTAQTRLKAETYELLKKVAIEKDLTLSETIRGILEGWAIGKIRKLKLRTP